MRLGSFARRGLRGETRRGQLSATALSSRRFAADARRISAFTLRRAPHARARRRHVPPGGQRQEQGAPTSVVSRPPRHRRPRGSSLRRRGASPDARALGAHPRLNSLLLLHIHHPSVHPTRLARSARDASRTASARSSSSRKSSSPSSACTRARRRSSASPASARSAVCGPSASSARGCATGRRPSPRRTPPSRGGDRRSSAASARTRTRPRSRRSSPRRRRGRRARRGGRRGARRGSRRSARRRAPPSPTRTRGW